MRIAICHENVVPARGGAEMYVADLARRLVSAGHDVELLACQWDSKALPQSILTRPIIAPKGPRFRRPWLFTQAIQQELKKRPVDLSIGFDKTFGTDIYYPLGGLQPASAQQNREKHRTGIGRWSAKIAKNLDPAHRSFLELERRYLLGPNPPLLVVNSEMVRGHALHFYGIPPEQVRVIHNAIDPARFQESDRRLIRFEERRRWGFGQGETVAAFVAMNYRLKGLEPLLRALAAVPPSTPLRLLVAGSPKTATWKRLAYRLGIEKRVVFAGPSTDVRNIYFASDLHVHPTFYDPCSGVVLEAMACGLPVITSRFNGAAELMNPPAEGFVLDHPHDIQPLTQALIALTDPVRQSSCGRAARLAASAWTIDDHYRRWLEVFTELKSKSRVA